MTEGEAIKICNTIGFATSFSNPQGIPINTTKEELTEAIRMSIQTLEKQKKIKESFEKWKTETGGYYGADDETTRFIRTLIQILRRDEEWVI